tara:strand:+ start:428 stop:1120 length:693 start_codon:yes stop_codon:yes gene_type:complete
MGFINNTSYILNAVLTKKGKEYLSKSSGNFNITKFALADDEIDYTLWDEAHPMGTDYYGAVLESTPMIESNVDPEVSMKYKLITLPEGTMALPYIDNVTQVVGGNKLKSTLNDSGWLMTDFTLNPATIGADGAFDGEKYSWLLLNNNVVEIRPGSIPAEGTFDDLPTTGAIYGEESGRLSKKIVSKVATIRAKQMIFDRETSIIVTGQQSGAIYVIRVQVAYQDERTSPA